MTLVDVVRFNAVLENVDWVEDLAGALPFERVERPRVNVLIDARVVKRGPLRWEILVGPRLTQCNGLVN